jgi:diacylglycerol kinase (ATP)
VRLVNKKTPMSLAVIVNPHALGVRRQPGLRDRLAAILGDAGEAIETRSPADLERAARRCAERGVQVIATCGGDGTNLMTVTALAEAYGRDRLPVLAILRGGTVNTVAENLGIRGKSEDLLTRLVAQARAGDLDTRGQDAICVTVPGQKSQIGFLFAAAMGARFLEAYYGGPRPGPAWAGVLAARTIASSLVTGPFARKLFAPLDVDIDVDGRRVTEVPRPTLFVASTVASVGIGMKVAWQAGRQPARFHVICSGLSTVKMALQFRKVVGGQPLDGRPHLDVLAQRATLRFAAPDVFTLDGELYREREVSIAMGPRLWIAQV